MPPYLRIFNTSQEPFPKIVCHHASWKFFITSCIIRAIRTAPFPEHSRCNNRKLPSDFFSNLFVLDSLSHVRSPPSFSLCKRGFPLNCLLYRTKRQAYEFVFRKPASNLLLIIFLLYTGWSHRLPSQYNMGS